MAKTKTQASSEATEATEFPVSLDEFCARLSAGDKRVELIAAFHHDETAAGRLRDLEGLYHARFAALATRPA